MFDYLKIKVPKGCRLCVFGDVHEHQEQFDKLINKFETMKDTVLVSVGDIYEKGFGEDRAQYITDKMRKLVDDGRAYVIRGNHELKMIRALKKTDKMTEQLSWFKRQPLALSFFFYNGSRVTVVHGGVRPSHTWADLRSNIETCYLRLVDNKGKLVKLKKKIEDGRKIAYFAKSGVVWHKLYDGRFGYIVSGHDSQKDGVPKFYNYSCNIDTACYHTGKLTAQMFGSAGREELLTFEGKAKFPDLDKMRIAMAKGLV